MLEAGGLGAQIDKIAGAYRGNPEALQKKTKLQPDLMDALALQKVMSEKAMAKQQLELSQQQDAGSVLEQMEQKLVGMNKEELTAQTAGIMGERNKKRQQQMSAAKPPQPQGQRPPMPQGAPQGLPAAPRPPMNMAQGGIIGYKKGEGVSAEEAEKKRILKLLGDKNVTSESWKAMSPEEQQRVAKVLNISQDNTTIGRILASPLAAAEDLIRLPYRMAGNLGAMVGNTDIGQSLGLGKIGQDKPMTSYLESTDLQQQAMKTQDRITDKGIAGALGIQDTPQDTPQVPSVAKQQVDPNQAKNDAMMAAMQGNAPTPDDPNAGAVMDPTLQAALDTPAVDLSGISRTQARDMQTQEVKDLQAKRLSDDPEEKRKEAVAELSGPSVVDGVETGGMDRQATKEGLEKFLQDKKDLDKQMLDPAAVDKRRTQAYMDGLITGGTGRTGTAARSQFDANLATSKQASIAEQKKSYLENITFDRETADKISARANEVFNAYKEDQAGAIDAANATDGRNLTAFYQEATLAIQTNQNGIANKISAFQANTASELQKMVQNQASMAELTTASAKFMAQITEIKDNYLGNVKPIMQTLEVEKSNPKTSPERRKEIVNQLNDYQNQASALEDVANLNGMVALMQDLIRDQAKNGGFSSQATTLIQNHVKSLAGSSISGSNSAQSKGIASAVPTSTPAPASNQSAMQKASAAFAKYSKP